MNENTLRGYAAANPLILLFLGACPALGATADVRAALGMGCAVLLVMLLSALVLSALKKAIPQQARVPAAILVVAGFAAIVQLLMNALLPTVYQMLGLYLAVAAVDLLILAGAEDAWELSVGKVLLQSLVLGAVFALMLLVTATLREVFGAGSFAGLDIPGLKTYNVPVLTQASGGFIVLSILAAVMNRMPMPSVFKGSFALRAAGLPVSGSETAEDKTAKEEAAQ